MTESAHIVYTYKCNIHVLSVREFKVEQTTTLLYLDEPNHDKGTSLNTRLSSRNNWSYSKYYNAFELYQACLTWMTIDSFYYLACVDDKSSNVYLFVAWARVMPFTPSTHTMMCLCF